MKAPEIIDELRSLGVELWEEAGRIRFRAPRGVLTDEHRDLLRAHRDEIVGLLAGDTGPRVTADPAARTEPFPLTEVQTAYLLGRQESFGYGGVACHGYLEIEYPELDPVRVEDAWNRLIARHDMLRAVVEADGYQHVLPEVPRCPVRWEASRDAVRSELGHRMYATDVWPLFELRVTPGVLHVSMDSLIADWASAGVLLDELDVLLADPDAELPPLELTFRDYLLAERAQRGTARYLRDRDYWLSRVDELPAAPDLPARAGETTGPVRFRRHGMRLSAPRWESLRAHAGRHGVTPSTAVLTAFATVLQRWARLPRFALNLTLLDRRPLHPQVDRVVGDFTSVTLLAVEDGTEIPFHEHARGVGEQLFADLDHRLYSGVEVGREIARRRGREAARMPVVFTSAVGVGGRTGHGLTQTPQVLLDCQVTDDADGLQVNWDVRQGSYPDGLVEDMAAAFEGLLVALADDAGTWTGAGPVALPDWQVEQRRRANDTAAPLPASLLHAGVIAQAHRTPDDVAVTGPAGTLTYRELACRAGGVAASLRAAGCEPGERVAIVVDKGPDQIVAVLGVLLAGGAYLPVDTTQPPLRREKLLAGVRHVLTTVGDVPPVDAIPDVPHGDPDGLAYVIYTSGSTGDPKGVMVSHRAALNTVQDVNRRFGVTARDRVLGLAQLGFDLSVYDIVGLLSAGGSVVLPDPARPADPSHWAALVAEYGVTLWNSVPAQLQMLAHYLESDPRPLPTLRLALLSGDWIPVTLPAQVRAFAPGLRMIGLGGATEAAIWSIHHPIEKVDPAWASVPYGLPLANQGFRVLDGARRDRPVWVPGELHIAGAGLAAGYFGDAALTAARFVTHPDGERLYRTGDLGRYLPGGEIEFLGREDDQVKIRGHRIELGEVESALLAHDAVGAAAAVVEGDRHGARALLAFVEPAYGAQPPPGPDLAAVSRFADRQVRGVEAGRVAEHVRLLHEAALISMRDALAGRGAVAERHQWLVNRWRALLPDRLPEITADRAWARLAGDDLITPEALEFYRTHVERVHELLDGTQNPFELLFPQGRTDRAQAIYRDTAIFRYLNHAAAALLNRIAAAHDRGPLRVLEIGAGTGATTEAVLPLLAGHDVDYLFTDISPFFLAEARERFADGDRVRFALFDVDEDHRAQGLAPNSFDVVLCAGVLSSTRRPEAVLDLVAPGGWLVFTEPTEEHPHIMLTQGFMMDGPSLRSREQWLGLVGGTELCLPEPGHPQAGQGIALFAARPKSDRAPVLPTDLAAFLARRLPAHMVPAHLQVVDRLPLTANGKVDRRTLAGWRPATLGAAPDPDTTPPDELEARLCARWAAALNIPAIGRTESFFDRGADSLILARVTGRLREEVPEAAGLAYDTLLRQMLNEPTVEALARALRSSAAPAPATPVAGRSGTGNSLLVPFGGGGDGPVRVLFHAALGTMDYFHSLANALVAQDLGPVVGLAVADADAYCEIDPKDLIARVADDYTDRLLAEGHTRFQLIGYCLGGLLATEVARRLWERGGEVLDLTLVDSIPMFIETDEELAFEAIFVPNLDLDPVEAVFGPDVDGADVYRAIDLLMTENDRVVPAGAMGALSGDPGLESVAAAVRRAHGRTQDERLAGYAAAAADRAGVPVGPELVPGLFRVTRHSMRAARFDPEPYAGDITFLRATEQQSFGITAGVGHLAAPFWERTCLGEFTVIDVPGNHFSVIEPPHLEVVAGHIAAAVRAGVTA
ncbi:non-ribosomal peptide synthetase [Pseudonocardia sp. HH130630-07]|uniref:non-ribosomal peptide synthetase n=1 Tax=Pseudonocardia sp. HH130630-07 TaxID=1690815 RepID=UPI000814D2FD|nr:non-ribosomal peptide synthetase [Pseudonocardia sp. HH130630-07]ANY08120.1 non-ribosomal peptide synthetase [Pseudonocardia sp. HH130630-07]